MVKEYNSHLLATRRENGRSINPLSAIVLFCKRRRQIASPKRIGFSCESQSSLIFMCYKLVLICTGTPDNQESSYFSAMMQIASEYNQEIDNLHHNILYMPFYSDG